MMRGPLTRSAVRLDHAVVAPDGHVTGPVPGWSGASRVVLVAPPLAGFAMSLVTMRDGGCGGPAPSGIGRFAYVLGGRVRVDTEDAAFELEAQGFAYLPPGVEHEVTAQGTARVCLIEKSYVPLAGAEPVVVTGNRAGVPAEHLNGDANVHVQRLLPEDPGLDLAVSTVSFAPGASLPSTETRVMEQGMLMLEGSLVYRLGDAWYPVTEGDALWTAPFCQQWCCCHGTGWASYLVYRDWNRDPQPDLGG
jgi:(S)-ureidoglycine aminohydrolase